MAGTVLQANEPSDTSSTNARAGSERAVGRRRVVVHKERTVRKAAGVVLGVVLALSGAVFTLQGLGYLAGSAMTGVTLWAVVGPILVVVGLLVLARSVRTDGRG